MINWKIRVNISLITIMLLAVFMMQRLFDEWKHELESWLVHEKPQASTMPSLHPRNRGSSSPRSLIQSHTLPHALLSQHNIIKNHIPKVVILYYIKSLRKLYLLPMSYIAFSSLKRYSLLFPHGPEAVAICLAISSNGAGPK